RPRRSRSGRRRRDPRPALETMPMIADAPAAVPQQTSGDPPRRPAARRVRSRRGGWDFKYSPYLYVAPFFVLFAAFGLFPVLFTVYTSLFRWLLLSTDRPYVGLANYERVLTDDKFWNAFVNTVGIFVVATVPQLLLAL